MDGERLEFAMENMDMEKIMEDIRASLPDSEEGWARIRFEVIPVDAAASAEESGTGHFDQEEFDKNAIRAGETWPVPYYRDIPGGKVKVFFKRVVRKLIRFCVDPITQDVTAFQQAVSRCLTSLRRYISEQFAAQRRQEAELDQLRRQVEELTERVRELEER